MIPSVHVKKHPLWEIFTSSQLYNKIHNYFIYFFAISLRLYEAANIHSPLRMKKFNKQINCDNYVWFNASYF